MPLSKHVAYYGRVPADVLAPLMAQVQAIPESEWVYRGDPESYKTKVIRQRLPSEVPVVLEWIEQHLLVPGTFNRVVLSMVPAGEEILPHTDNFGEVRHYSIHGHLSLITDPSIVLGFEDPAEEWHLAEGTVYRMDESHRHYVKNPSDVDRIHLLFAFWPHNRQLQDVLEKGA